MSNKIMKIGIIGSLGMVGSTLKRYFQKTKNDLFLYDIAGEGSLEEVNWADYIYIAVPTPTTEEGCDISAINEVLGGLREKDSNYQIHRNPRHYR